MNKSKIEWCDYSLNPVKGLCPMACPYCYARRLYKRFKWNPEIRYTDPGFTIADIQSIKQPSRIFVGSTMELFWDWPEIWLRDTFTITRQFPQHTFIFLTKQPQNLIKWSPFPENCWVGVSPITNGQLLLAIGQLEKIKAKVKFLSIEPMRNELDAFKFAVQDKVVDWVIIGQQTPVRMSTMPQIGWIKEIVLAADKAGIPVFLKDNLISCVDQYEFALKDGKYRQEYPPQGE